MAITVFGYSDDLIEVDGDIRDEFPIKDDTPDGGDLLAFSDGTLLRITYTKDGIWRITPLVRGSAELGIEQAPDNGGYSDRATLSGAVWVVHGIGHASRKDPR